MFTAVSSLVAFSSSAYYSGLSKPVKLASVPVFSFSSSAYSSGLYSSKATSAFSVSYAEL